MRNFASPDTAKWPFFSILGGISKKFFRQCKSGGFLAKFFQELKFGILIKIKMVWLLFETSRNLRNFASPDTAKWPFFSILGGISKKSLGSVNVEVFRQIWSVTLIWYSNENNDGLVTISDLKKF